MAQSDSVFFPVAKIGGVTARHFLMAAVFLAAVGLCPAQEFRLESVGARVGASPRGAGRYFHEADAFVNLDLPWQWGLGKQWWLQPRLDFSAGWLGTSSVDAAVGNIAFSLLLGRESFPLSLEAGSGPTWISEDHFGVKDFGDFIQFTTDVGLNLDLGKHVRIGYRFQHMSNAGLGPYNPGLNLHFLKLSYLF